MTIASSSVFDTVGLVCNCESGEFGGHQVQVGRTALAGSGDTSILPLPRVLSPTNAEVAEVISRVRAGTVKAYYADLGPSPQVWAPVESAPFEFWQFHGRHPFWPDDGYKMLDRLATQGDLVESPGNRHFAFNGGVVPGKTPAASAMVDQSLGDWHAFNNGSAVGFRLVIPASEDITTGDIETYPRAKAMRDFLESIRVPGTGSQLPAALGINWPNGVEFDFVISGVDTLRLERPTASFTRTSEGVIVGVWIVMDLHDDTRAGSVDTAGLNALLDRTTVSIPGTGLMVENLWGDRQIRGYARDLVFAGGRISMPNGLPLAHFEDMDHLGIPRVVPMASGFGRSISGSDLPALPGGSAIRRLPYAEEMPFVNAIHMSPGQDAQGDPENELLQVHDIAAVVGFGGIDRRLDVHNIAAPGNGSIVLRDHNAQEMLHVRPGEAVGVRVLLSTGGRVEIRIEDAPHRYLIHAGANFLLSNTYYSTTIEGVDYYFLPWFPDTSRVRRRDVDEFTFGTGLDPALETDLDNLLDSDYVVTVKHHGDFIFYEQTEVEITGNGTIPAGHSAVLVRQRGSTVSVIGRFWQSEFSGTNEHRGYTTAFVNECEPGDKYVAGLLTPRVGTTVTFGSLTGVRMNTISQIHRVAPRINVT